MQSELAMTMPLSPGAVLVGKYRVDRVIGSGGMAVVLAATHLQLREPVAIKLLHRHVLSHPGALERFLREARVAMRLRSEHVARVFDVSTMEDGTPFIVMELLQGADFATLLQERGPFPVSTAIDYLLQACQALSEAHAAGVVHRDLKPANLFLCPSIDGSPCVKVLDFGVSKLLVDDAGAPDPFALTAPPSARFPAEAADQITVPPVSPAPMSPHAGPAVTLTHAFLGSPRYMAPEQIRSARDVDIRADIWALGVILQELITGVAPFRGATLSELCNHILEEPAAPFALPSGSVPEIHGALAGCLAKDPRDRYQDIRAFVEAMARYGSADSKASHERIVRMTEARVALGHGRSSLLEGLAPALTADPPASGAFSRPATVRRFRLWAPIAIAVGAGLSVVAFVGPRIAKRPSDAPIAAPAASAIQQPLPSMPSVSERPRADSPPVAAPTTLATATPTTAAPPSPKHPPVRAATPLAKPRAPAAASTAAPAHSASAAADPLGLDTGALFMERR
jgi:serine/threonine protein kinase